MFTTLHAVINMKTFKRNLLYLLPSWHTMAGRSYIVSIEIKLSIWNKNLKNHIPAAMKYANRMELSPDKWCRNQFCKHSLGTILINRNILLLLYYFINRIRRSTYLSSLTWSNCACGKGFACVGHQISRHPLLSGEERTTLQVRHDANLMTSWKWPRRNRKVKKPSWWLPCFSQFESYHKYFTRLSRIWNNWSLNDGYHTSAHLQSLG